MQFVEILEWRNSDAIKSEKNAEKSCARTCRNDENGYR